MVYNEVKHSSLEIFTISVQKGGENATRLDMSVLSKFTSTMAGNSSGRGMVNGMELKWEIPIYNKKREIIH